MSAGSKNKDGSARTQVELGDIMPLLSAFVEFIPRIKENMTGR